MVRHSWKILVVIVVWLAVGWGVGFVRPVDRSLGVELPAWVRWPGVVALVLGGVGVIACGAMLSDRGIGTLRGEEWFMPTEFLATGPFRFVRNPMSLAGVVLIVGIALWHRSTLGLGLAAALWLVFHLVIVRLEEPGLEKRFGELPRVQAGRAAVDSAVNAVARGERLIVRAGGEKNVFEPRRHGGHGAAGEDEDGRWRMADGAGEDAPATDGHRRTPMRGGMPRSGDKTATERRRDGATKGRNRTPTLAGCANGERSPASARPGVESPFITASPQAN